MTTTKLKETIADMLEQDGEGFLDDEGVDRAVCESMAEAIVSLVKRVGPPSEEKAGPPTWHFQLPFTEPQQMLGIGKAFGYVRAETKEEALAILRREMETAEDRIDPNPPHFTIDWQEDDCEMQGSDGKTYDWEGLDLYPEAT